MSNIRVISTSKHAKGQKPEHIMVAVLYESQRGTGKNAVIEQHSGTRHLRLDHKDGKYYCAAYAVSKDHPLAIGGYEYKGTANV